jgi:hypothetical protein
MVRAQAARPEKGEKKTERDFYSNREARHPLAKEEHT